MRFSIIYLVSLLLAPSLVSSKPFLPPSSPPSLVPSSPPSSPASSAPHTPPPFHQLRPPPPIPVHGDIVIFQGHQGPQHGVVMESQQHRLNIAPLLHDSPLPPQIVNAHADRLVSAHPGDVARTAYASDRLVAGIQEYHRANRPNIHQAHAAGPVEGSPNHQSAHGWHRGDHGSGGTRGHRRR